MHSAFIVLLIVLVILVLVVGFIVYKPTVETGGLNEDIDKFNHLLDQCFTECSLRVRLVHRDNYQKSNDISLIYDALDTVEKFSNVKNALCTNIRKLQTVDDADKMILEDIGTDNMKKFNAQIATMLRRDVYLDVQSLNCDIVNNDNAFLCTAKILSEYDKRITNAISRMISKNMRKHTEAGEKCRVKPDEYIEMREERPENKLNGMPYIYNYSKIATSSASSAVASSDTTASLSVDVPTPFVIELFNKYNIFIKIDGGTSFRAIYDPELLMYDEISTNLDPNHSDIMKDQIRKTHNINATSDIKIKGLWANKLLSEEKPYKDVNDIVDDMCSNLRKIYHSMIYLYSKVYYNTPTVLRYDLLLISPLPLQYANGTNTYDLSKLKDLTPIKLSIYKVLSLYARFDARQHENMLIKFGIDATHITALGEEYVPYFRTIAMRLSDELKAIYARLESDPLYNRDSSIDYYMDTLDLIKIESIEI
jgi:hypothetical protein